MEKKGFLNVTSMKYNCPGRSSWAFKQCIDRPNGLISWRKPLRRCCEYEMISKTHLYYYCYSIRRLNQLEILRMWGNELPTWISELKSLKEINVSRCSLSKIPAVYVLLKTQMAHGYILCSLQKAIESSCY